MFTQKKFKHWVCDFSIDFGVWKELEVTFDKASEGQEPNLSAEYRPSMAAYKLNGASLEIYMPSYLCAHEFEFLIAKLSQDSIYGYQTIDARFWGSRDVIGKLKALKVALPEREEISDVW